ncbi:bacteriohemerythrin [Noviherbaspirillum album]|uniref:bacteriohemerythrin n=1 Tax=Noviherbaspirillum album TaxID=3080276 RepID=UPI00345F2F8D
MLSTDLTSLPWSSEISVGHPALDGLNKDVFDLLAVIESTVHRDDAESIVGQFSQLFSTLSHALDVEEKLLGACDYPELECHITIHDQVRSYVHAWKRSLGAGHNHAHLIRTARRIHAEVTSWLIQHIQGVDALYRPYMVTHSPLTAI